MQEHVVFVAFLEAELVGWIDLGIVHHLQSATHGEIGELIVAHGGRGLDIGKRLVKKGEEWLADQAIKNVALGIGFQQQFSIPARVRRPTLRPCSTYKTSSKQKSSE